MADHVEVTVSPSPSDVLMLSQQYYTVTSFSKLRFLFAWHSLKFNHLTRHPPHAFSLHSGMSSSSFSFFHFGFSLIFESDSTAAAWYRPCGWTHSGCAMSEGDKRCPGTVTRQMAKPTKKEIRYVGDRCWHLGWSMISCDEIVYIRIHWAWNEISHLLVINTTTNTREIRKEKGKGDMGRDVVVSTLHVSARVWFFVSHSLPNVQTDKIKFVNTNNVNVK